MKLAGKSVLVTGAAGFIGSHLVDRILDESPACVVAVDNLFLGRKENLQEAIRRSASLSFERADAADYDAMKVLLKKHRTQVVFNLAVIPLPTSLEKPRWTVDVNVAIATVAAELLREGLYETLIHFSSSEAYGTAQRVPMDETHPLHPETPYAASKLAGDHVIFSYRRTFGIDAAIVRPFNNFGPRQNAGAYAGVIPIFARKALNGEALTIDGDGEQTRDFVFVRDTVHGAVRVYEEPATRGQVINLATGQECSVNRLAAEIQSVLGTTVPVVYGPPRPGDVRRHCGGIGLARQLIGFKPAVLNREHMIETLNWYRQLQSCA